MSDILAGSPLIQATGLALVAFFWQGAIIGVVAMSLAALSRRASPNLRYVLGCAALVALAIAPVVTVTRDLHDRPPSTAGDRSVAGPTAAGARLTATEPSQPIAQDAGPVAREPLSIVVIFWGAGVCVCGVQLLRGGRQVARLRRTASPLAAADRLAVVHRLAERLHLTSLVQVFESRSIDVPAAIGWLRPAIVVPVSALAGLSPSHFEAILAHELAHVRRRDYLVNIVQRVIETLLFYHPAVWWVSGWIRREREHCCDELAASVCGDRVGYARALRALEELRAGAPALAMGASGGDLLVRITRLVDKRFAPLPGWPGGLAMIVPAFVLFTFGPAKPPSTPPRVLQPVVIQSAIATVQVTLPPDAAPAAGVNPRRVFAAQPLAQVSGLVQDQTGGMVPGATVRLRSQTSSTQTAMTTATGSFSFSDVAPGEYTLEITLSGFKRSQVPINVAPGGWLVVRTALHVGSVAEEVTVTSSSSESAASGELAASLESAADYLAAARYYYTREAFADAELMMARAVAITHAAQPAYSVPAATPGVVRVGGSIREPRKIYDQRAIYPSAARASGVEGTVTISAVIAADGTVADATVTSTASLFDDAAIGAVRQWLFTPTLMNGVPIEVGMTVTINFKMR